jgi:thioredoxin-related protein
MSKVLLVILCTGIYLSAYSQYHINFSKSPVDSIEKEVQGNNKLIYLFFTNPGCMPCKRMEKVVFTDSSVARLYNENFISTIVNNTGKDQEAKRLCTKYEIIRYPTHLFINSKGEVVNRTSGYQDAETFRKLGVNTLSNITRDYYYNRIIAGDCSFETVRQGLYLEEPVLLFADSNYRCRAQEILDHYFSRQKEEELSSKESWFLIRNYVYNPHSEIFQYLVTHQDEFVKHYGRQKVDIAIYTILAWYVSGDPSSERFKIAEKEVRTMDIPQSRVWVRFGAIVDESYKIRRDSTGNWNDLVRNANVFILENYYMINQFEINTWCWTMYIDYTKGADISNETLKNICQWMKNISEFNKDFEHEDTYAHILFTLGEQGKAIEIEELALNHAIQEKADKESIETFRKELEIFKLKK